MPDQNDQLYANYDQFYNRGNPDRDQLYKRHARNYARQFGSLLGENRHAKILDLGSATGMLVAYIKSQGYNNVTGVDQDEKLIEQARQHVDAEFVVADANEFLAGPGRFDIIFMLNLLEHIDRQSLVKFTTAVANALNPGGFAVIRTPNMNNIVSAGHLADDVTHCTGLTEQSLTQLALAAGFANTTMLNQFAMQNFKGKIKAITNQIIHRPPVHSPRRQQTKSLLQKPIRKTK